jgi:hypothetical protein
MQVTDDPRLAAVVALGFLRELFAACWPRPGRPIAEKLK